jgi:osmotically-inducible protein OsmY
MYNDYRRPRRVWRDEQDRGYSEDEHQMRWNADYQGYGPPPEEQERWRRLRAHTNWEPEWRHDDHRDRDERLRSRLGQGSYGGVDEYGRADYRGGADHDRERRDAERSYYGSAPGEHRPHWTGDQRAYGRYTEPSTPRRHARELEPDRFSHYGRGPSGYKRSDDRIHEDVSDRLYEDHDIDASEIDVRVADGVVTFEGTVEDRSMKRLAEDLALDVVGVSDVINHLTIRREDGGAGRKHESREA